VQFFCGKNLPVFENYPDGHEFPDIMVGDRGLVNIFKFFADVNT
jgi:hypothetical protein